MSLDRTAVRFRAARESDAERVAALHAASWRANYRGSFRDSYLDGPIELERRRVWSERLNRPRTGQAVILAEHARDLAGFVCGFADHDPTWGTLIDNLHVLGPHKGSGVGRALMAQIAQEMMRRCPGRPIYLHVLEVNHAARGFYCRLGGQPVEHGRSIEPDGNECAVVRYAWPSPARLRDVAAQGRISGLAGRSGTRVKQPDQGQSEQDRHDDPDEQRA